MQRHRCHKCRNPIRSVAVARPGAATDAAWFHPDCWAEVCSSEQANYEREVAAAGIAALLAPYIPGPRIPDPVVEEAAVEQPQS